MRAACIGCLMRDGELDVELVCNGLFGCSPSVTDPGVVLEVVAFLGLFVLIASEAGLRLPSWSRVRVFVEVFGMAVAFAVFAGVVAFLLLAAVSRQVGLDAVAASPATLMLAVIGTLLVAAIGYLVGRIHHTGARAGRALEKERP